jgi:zinc protease
MMGADTGFHNLPGPRDITRRQLSNEIVVLARANFNSPSIVVSGYLTVGGLSDPAEKLGLAEFTAQALMRGTQRYPFQQLYDSLESVGASLGFGGGTHTTGFGGAALVEDLDLLLEILAQAITQPVFPVEQIERLRAQFITSLAIRAQDTARMASLAFDRLVYAGHPYSRPEDGYPDTIQSITQTDLVDFHQRGYGPHAAVISVVGAIEPLLAVEKVARVLGDWRNPMQIASPELPPLQPLDGVITDKVSIPGKSQADLVIGAAGPSRSAEDYLAASLGNNILGQFGMMGRIGEVVREKAGLAYYADSNLGGGLGPGPWSVSAGIDPVNSERAADLIRAEIRRFTSQPVTPEELADSVAHYIGRLPLSLESNAGVASALISLERYKLGLDYYQRYPGLVQSIDEEDILAAARRYLDPDRLAIALAGP